MSSTANPRHVARRRRSEKRREHRDRTDMEQILATGEGRRFVWSLIVGNWFLDDIPVDDPGIQAYMLGQRSVAIRLRELVKSVRPEALMMMEAEYDEDVAQQAGPDEAEGAET
jgi:hypothetical protein